MHEVHALIRRRLPGATSARTDWMFGFQRRGVRRCECDTDIPKPGPLPHTSHTAATVDHSQRIVHRRRGKAAPASRPSRSLTALGARTSPHPPIRRRIRSDRPVLSHHMGTLRPCCRRWTTPRSVQWYRAAVEVLSASRGRLDDLNVFPVPDGDTGTNLLLTAQAAVAALDSEGPRTTESAWSVLARGAVLGARGNSGTILAQLLRGLADQLAGQPPADGPAFAAALQKAADTAYTAVADPEEGTFLTVARAGAEAAVAAVDAGRADLADVVRAAADGARVALEAHPRPARGPARGRGRRRRRRRPLPRPRRPGHDRDRRRAGPPAAGPPRPRRTTTPASTCRTSRRPARAARCSTSSPTADEDAVARLHAPPRRARRQPRRRRRRHPDAAASGTSTCTSPTSAPRSRPASRPAVRTGSRSPRWPRCPRRRPCPGTRAVVAVVASEGLAELFRGEGVRVVTCGPDGVTEDDILDEVIASAAARGRRPAQRRRR